MKKNIPACLSHSVATHACAWKGTLAIIATSPGSSISGKRCKTLNLKIRLWLRCESEDHQSHGSTSPSAYPAGARPAPAWHLTLRPTSSHRTTPSPTPHPPQNSSSLPPLLLDLHVAVHRERSDVAEKRAH